tara:strand:+ start:2664 stop:3242 length:579 start_codon:yes stop_codon:yes gene_type:complete
MGKILKFPSLEQYLAGLKSSGGLIKMDNGSYIIKHYEVENLAREFGVITNIELVNCDLTKSCAVVKAQASFEGKTHESLGEVSPLNNNFVYPVAVAEKRAVDRAILKALGLHGKYYSDVEMPPEKKTENQGIKLDHTNIILDRIKNCSHQANLDQLKRENKEFLEKLFKEDKSKLEKIKLAFDNRKQQLIGG